MLLWRFRVCHFCWIIDLVKIVSLECSLISMAKFTTFLYTPWQTITNNFCECWGATSYELQVPLLTQDPCQDLWFFQVHNGWGPWCNGVSWFVIGFPIECWCFLLTPQVVEWIMFTTHDACNLKLAYCSHQWV